MRPRRGHQRVRSQSRLHLPERRCSSPVWVAAPHRKPGLPRRLRSLASRNRSRCNSRRSRNLAPRRQAKRSLRRRRPTPLSGTPRRQYNCTIRRPDTLDRRQKDSTRSPGLRLRLDSTVPAVLRRARMSRETSHRPRTGRRTRPARTFHRCRVGRRCWPCMCPWRIGHSTTRRRGSWRETLRPRRLYFA